MALGIINKSIRNKLLIITGLATAIVVGAALFGFSRAWFSIDAYEAITNGAVHNEHIVLVMTSEFKKQEQEWKNMLLRGSDPKNLDKYWSNFLREEAKVDKLGSELQQNLQNGEAKTLVNDFIQAHKMMGQSYRKGLAAFKASGYISHAGDAAVAGMARSPTKLLETASALISRRNASMIKSALFKARHGIEMSISIMLLAVALATAFFFWFTQKFIVSPSRQLREDLAQLAAGNFTHRIDSVSQDEIGQIAVSAQHLQHELGNTISHLSSASRQLADSSEQLTAVVDHTNRGVTQQREQIDMVATAMNEMVATVHEVSRNTSQAAESAFQANQEASTGKQVITTTTNAIDLLAADVETAAGVIRRLEEHSNAIGSVLDVIRGIAEQTNLLALNAAIEAARAGEQGRGFAVVADEVRTLAQRTQQSTSEIQEMIEQLQDGSHQAVSVMSESQNRAKSTVEHAMQAGQVLETIVSAIAAISEMNTQIATAAEEQSSVAEEIGRNIVTISQAAEQSAESVEQTSRSSEELSTLANQLQQVASRFRV